MPPDDRSVLRRVLYDLRPHRWQITAGLATTVAASLLGALQPLLMRSIVDEAIPNRRWGLLVLLTLGLALVPIVRLGLGTLQILWINGSAQQVARTLRVRLLDHLLHMPLTFFNENKTGELMERIRSDCGRLAVFVSDDLVPAAANTLQLSVLVVVLLYLDATLALLVFLVFPLFHFLARGIGRRQAATEAEWQGVRGEGSALLQEILGGVRTIKSFTREAYESTRWRNWNNHDLALWLRRTNWTQVLAATNQTMISVGVALVMGIGGWQVATERMSFGTLLAFFAYVPQFYATCGALLTSQVEMGNLESYMARVFEILDLSPEPHTDVVSNEAVVAKGYDVIFENVSFAYDDERREGIADLSFQIAPGEFVAFIGASGGGKSTILDLLMGFYTPSTGKIRLDNVDLHELPLEELRQKVAIVSQDVHVWNGTIRANLCYANEDAADAQIRDAVKAAQLTSFIERLPQGYETIIGERGVRLSGGERQRLSIARALLRNPRLLLLDEVTAALDALTERALQEGLRPFFQRCTVIVVAHRLSTILECDRVFVVDGGHIVQQGTHAELRHTPGHYRDLFEAQFREGTSTTADVDVES